jgi:thiol:disulfide interchange protein DsbC
MKLRAALLIALVMALPACRRPQADVPPVGASATDTPAESAAMAPPPAQPVSAGDPRIALAAMMPGVKPEDLRITPVASLYELAHDGEISYVTADGKYVFTGDLFQVTQKGDFPNLTEVRRRELRLQLIAGLSEEEMIVFGKARAPRVITVFTDVDCQWCQHMHSQIAEYNALGIRVRYLAYPRSGPESASAHTLEAVWCAKDRKAALTLAKKGESFKSRKCATPVAKHYALGQQMGITGTPGVILPSGELIPGYRSPKEMLQAIEQTGAQPVGSS